MSNISLKAARDWPNSDGLEIFFEHYTNGSNWANECAKAIRKVTVESPGSSINILVDKDGQPFSNVTDIWGISTDACVQYCPGDSSRNFDILNFGVLSYLLPAIALTAQLPYETGSVPGNLLSFCIAIGSPGLITFSLLMTVFSARQIRNHSLLADIAGAVGSSEYLRKAADAASEFLQKSQELPLRMDRIALDKILEQPDWFLSSWWTSVMAHLKSHRCRISSLHATWLFGSVFIELFMVVYGAQPGSAPQSLRILWLWLVPVVFGWILIGYTYRHDTDYLLPQSSGDLRGPWKLGMEVHAGSNDPEGTFLGKLWTTLQSDEINPGPIFNYARVFTVPQQVDLVGRAFEERFKKRKSHSLYSRGRHTPDITAQSILSPGREISSSKIRNGACFQERVPRPPLELIAIQGKSSLGECKDREIASTHKSPINFNPSLCGIVQANPLVGNELVGSSFDTNTVSIPSTEIYAPDEIDNKQTFLSHNALESSASDSHSSAGQLHTRTKAIDQTDNAETASSLNQNNEVLAEEDLESRPSVQSKAPWRRDFMTANVLSFLLLGGVVGAAVLVDYSSPAPWSDRRSPSYLLYGGLGTVTHVLILSSVFLSHKAALLRLRISAGFDQRVRVWAVVSLAVVTRVLGKIVVVLNTFLMIINTLFDLTSPSNSCQSGKTLPSLLMSSSTARDWVLLFRHEGHIRGRYQIGGVVLSLLACSATLLTVLVYSDRPSWEGLDSNALAVLETLVPVLRGASSLWESLIFQIMYSLKGHPFQNIFARCVKCHAIILSPRNSTGLQAATLANSIHEVSAGLSTSSSVSSSTSSSYLEAFGADAGSTGINTPSDVKSGTTYQRTGNGLNDGEKQNDKSTPYQNNVLHQRDFVYIILQDGNHRRQVMVDITNCATDHALSVKLNEAYRKHRGALRVLTTLNKLRLTKYRLYSDNHVQSLFDPNNLRHMIPPANNLIWRYTYNPSHEPIQHPLIGDCELRHLFDHPIAFRESREFRNRLPKTSHSLSHRSARGFPIGWGIEFTEGINWWGLVLWESFLAALAILICTIWIPIRQWRGHDDGIAVASGIGQWIFGLGQVVGIMYTALACTLETWRY